MVWPILLSLLGGPPQTDGEDRAAVRGVGGRDGAVVVGDDRADDREAQAGAAGASDTAALGAPEALEELSGVPGWEALAVVADDELDGAVAVAQRDCDGRARRRVHERVSQQVGQHLVQLVG